MQKQIESVILSNVGNRLTQELAYGLIMTISHLAQQAVDAAHAAATTGPAADQVGAAPAPVNPTAGQSGGFQEFVDPAYARPPVAEPKRARKPATTQRARR
ncbi:hypothetical protein WJ976_12700 [Achromobacter denitrificans]